MGWNLTDNDGKYCVEAFNRECDPSCDPSDSRSDVVCRIFGHSNLTENNGTTENFKIDQVMNSSYELFADKNENVLDIDNVNYKVIGQGSFFLNTLACVEGEVKPDSSSFDESNPSSVYSQKELFNFKAPDFSKTLNFKSQFDLSSNTDCNDFQCTVYDFDASLGCDFCHDDFNLVDSQGRTCQWYYSNTLSCGNFDISTFTASQICCACRSSIIDESIRLTNLELQKSSAPNTEVKFSINKANFAVQKFCIKCDFQNQRFNDKNLAPDSDFMPIAEISTSISPITSSTATSPITQSTYSSFYTNATRYPVGRAFGYLLVNLKIIPTCQGTLKESFKFYEPIQSGNVTIIEEVETNEAEGPKVMQVKNMVVDSRVMTVSANQYHGFVLYQPELEDVVQSFPLDCRINKTSFEVYWSRSLSNEHPNMTLSYDPDDKTGSMNVYVKDYNVLKYGPDVLSFYIKVEVMGYDDVLEYTNSSSYNEDLKAHVDWLGNFWGYKLTNYTECQPSYARFNFSAPSDIQIVSPGPQNAYFQLNITLQEGSPDCSPMRYFVGFMENFLFVQSELLTITRIDETFKALGKIPSRFDTSLVDRTKGEFIIWPKDPYDLEQSYENMYVMVNDTGNSSALWGPVRMTLLKDTFTAPHFKGQPTMDQIFEFNVKDSDTFLIHFSKILDDWHNFCEVDISSPELGSVKYSNCSDTVKEYQHTYSLNYTFDHQTDKSLLTINTKKLKLERFENNVTVVLKDFYGNTNWVKFTVNIIDEARIDFQRTFVLEQACGRLYQQWQLPQDVKSVVPDGWSGKRDDYFVDGIIYVRFDERTKNLIVGGIKSEKAVGQYLAKVKNEYNSGIVNMNMRINIISNQALRDDALDCFGSSLEPEEQENILSCKILSISKKGEVAIEFSEDMKQVDPKTINQNLLNLTINRNQILSEDGQNPKEIKFGWYTKSFVKTILFIQLEFEDSLEVSKDPLQRDILTVHFPDGASSFVSDTSNQTLHKSSHHITKSITPQYKAQDLGTSAVELKKEIAGFLTLGFWLILLFNQIASSQFSGHIYIQLINSLQMIIYLPLLQVGFPANAMSIMLFTRPVAMFDVLDGLENTEWSLEEIGNIWAGDDGEGQEKYERLEFSEQMSEMGFESLYALLNLGSMSFFLTIYVVKAVLFLVAYPVFVLGLGVKKEFIIGQLKAAFFNEIILMTIEGSFDIFISAYLQSFDFKFEFQSIGSSVSTILAVICFLLTCVLIPAVYYFIMSQPNDLLNTEDFKQRFGSFYQNIKTSSKITLSFSMIFVLRRLLFVIIIFTVPSQGLQFVMITILNLLVGVFIGNFYPKESLQMNRLEFFNEVMIQSITFHVIPLSNLVNDPHIQYSFGYSMFVTVIILESVNISLVIYHVSRQVFLIIKKYYNLGEFYWGVFKEKAIRKMIKYQLIKRVETPVVDKRYEGHVTEEVYKKNMEVIAQRMAESRLVKERRVEEEKMMKKAEEERRERWKAKGEEGEKAAQIKKKSQLKSVKGTRNKDKKGEEQLRTIQEENEDLVDLKQNTKRNILKPSKASKVKKGIVPPERQYHFIQQVRKIPTQPFQSLPRNQKNKALRDAYSLRQQFDELEDQAGERAAKNSFEKRVIAKLDYEIATNEINMAFDEFNKTFQANLELMAQETAKIRTPQKQQEEGQKYLPWIDHDES